MTDHAELIEKSHALAGLDSSRGYLNFLDHVVVDAQPRKRPFRQIAEWWQWERSLRSAAAIENLAAYRDDYTGPKSFWNGYHKGSDKTHDSARELCWLLGWSKRRLNCYVCAGSEDQAALLTTAMQGILLDNKWIADRVWVTKLTGGGESGSTLTVLPMNAYTGQGVFPDYVIASEVTHWMHEDGRKFWEFILESVNKRPDCVLKVETNAGVKGSWQWEERKRISQSKFWSFYEAPVGKPLPTWMNQEKIDDDSQGLTPGERDRLYKNRWIDPGEDRGYLTLEQALECRDAKLVEKVRGERGIEYTVVLDYGGVNDRAALAVMHTPPGEDRAVVDRLDCWQGTHENRIAIMYDPERPDERSVQGWLELTLRHFFVTRIVLDPYQLEGLAVYYERRGRRVERFEYRAGKKNHRMAQLLKTCVINRRISWSPDAGRLPKHYAEQGRVVEVDDDTLEAELSMLVTKTMIYGYRFDHEAGRHDDRAVVLGMGLVHLLPEVPPAGGQGPVVVTDSRPTAVPGATPSRRQTPEHDPVAAWRIFGSSPQGGGSAWDRGDLGDKP